jgi:hypothetical protein
MKINKKTALAIWEEAYGNSEAVQDFSGRWMVKDAYGERDAEEELADFTNDGHDEGTYINVGWDVHHILPISKGGASVGGNLLCVNAETNQEAGDKTTFWANGSLFQIRRDVEDGYYLLNIE